ncbi:cytochrome P450 [Mycena galopus ATCC 62051]|nr:cytochrome P450 [Mycena galopus ATCC 62051]
MSSTICILLLPGACVARIVSRRLFSALRSIPGPERRSLYTGNLTHYHDPDGWEFQRELESNYNEVVKLQGWFGPWGAWQRLFLDLQLFIFDPAVLHSILVKNQDHYEQMPQFLSMSRLFFGKGIFSTIGEENRKYRKIMMPAFSTSNLRGMIPSFYEVAEKARGGLISPHVIDGLQTLDLNSIFARVSLEMIGRAGIGHSFDPMLPGEQPTDQYAKSLRVLFPVAFKLSMFFPLSPILEKIPLPSLQRHAFASALVMNRKARMKSKQLDAKDDARDVMSLLTNNMNVDGTMYLTDDELLASTSTMLSAATDTTSAALSRIFYVLATYPEVQERLRAEIIATPEHPNHDALVTLPYLDAVLREILRLHPPVLPGMFGEFSRPDPQIKWRKTDAVPSPSIEGHPKVPILVDRLEV